MPKFSAEAQTQTLRSVPINQYISTNLHFQINILPTTKAKFTECLFTISSNKEQSKKQAQGLPECKPLPVAECGWTKRRAFPWHQDRAPLCSRAATNQTHIHSILRAHLSTWCRILLLLLVKAGDGAATGLRHAVFCSVLIFSVSF